MWDIPIMPFIIGIIALVVGPAMVVLVVWLLIRNVGNRRSELHRERMAMIDKGMVPAEMAVNGMRDDGNGFPPMERRLMKGITWASIGMALTLWFLFMGAGGGTIIGLIPLFLGLSWIAFYVIGRTSPREEERSDSEQAEPVEPEAPAPTEEVYAASDDTDSP